MKKIVTLTFTLSLALHVFGQLDFLPLGSTRYEKFWCIDGSSPIYYQKTVTVDSIIAGKYCTRIPTSNYPCSVDGGVWLFVYQEDGRVYRWEHSTSTFHLALDFSKQLGESWRVGICDDSVTITVELIQGIRRVVSVLGDAVTTWDFPELDLYEGFGGIVNNPLLFSLELIIVTKPPCYRQVLCYEDPVLGIVYSGWESCISATENLEDIGDVMSIYPNPGIDVVPRFGSSQQVVPLFF